MDIIRAGFGDIDLFNHEQLERGACCFYSSDRLNKYFFEINGQEAVLHTNSLLHIDEAIDTFLFYSGFISRIKSPGGRLLRERVPSPLIELEVQKIQPSQFYINKQKLDNCKKWIQSQSDIMIPISNINGKIVSLDGHTRLRAAADLGYQRIYTYHDDCDDYIAAFAKEAIHRNILSVYDMEVLFDSEYSLKWHKFCDDFFERTKRS